MRKICSLLFMMTIVLVGFCGINNVKADNYPEYIKIGGKTLNSEKPYYQNYDAVANCTLGTDGCGAYYDAKKGELTLHNFNFALASDNFEKIIENETENTDLTIKLIGTNQMNSLSKINYYVAISNAGNLTITSDDDASFSAYYGLVGREKSIGILNTGNLTIGGKADVSLSVRSTIHNEIIGIKNENGSVNIEDNAKLTINGDYGTKENSNSKLYGIYATETNINTNSDVTVRGSSEFRGSIYGNLNLIKFNKVILSGRNTYQVSDYANIKIDDTKKFLFDFEESIGNKSLIITKDNRLAGIMLYNKNQYEDYIGTVYEKLVLANDIEHTSTTELSSYCDDRDNDNYDGIYCASFMKVHNGKTIDLNGHTLTVKVLNLRFSNSATFTITDSSEAKTGTLAIPNNNIGVFNVADNYNGSKDQTYNLVFDGGNYSYGDSFCIYSYCKTSLIYVENLYRGKLNINYKNNPVFINNGGTSLFRTNDSNVNMIAEAMTYKYNGNKYTNLSSSSDNYFGSKTYNDLIDKYTTDAFVNNERIQLNHPLNNALEDAIAGDNEIVIKPKTTFDITMSIATNPNNKTYNGKAQTQNIKVTYNGTILRYGTDYTIVYKNNINVGTATMTIVGKGKYIGQIQKTFKINKANNPLTVKTSTKTVKKSKVKKKNQTVKAITVTSYRGKLTYTKASGSKKLTINKTTGKITVKKGTKKGTYKIKVKVKAAGNSNYNSGSKTVTVKVKVK